MKQSKVLIGTPDSVQAEFNELLQTHEYVSHTHSMVGSLISLVVVYHAN